MQTHFVVTSNHAVLRVAGRMATGLVALTISLALLSTAAPATEPARAISATQALGCCVCRGTAGGDATAVRACSDARNANSCVSACKDVNADSIVFGYQQTCAQGCAGFPTQNLK